MLYIKLVQFAWPFLKEMFLGKKTLQEALRDAKGRLAAVAIVIGSILLNYITVPKLVAISKDYVLLRNKHEEAMVELEKLRVATAKLQKPPVPHIPKDTGSATPVVAEHAVKKKAQKQQPTDRKIKAKQAFDEMANSEKKLEEPLP